MTNGSNISRVAERIPGLWGAIVAALFAVVVCGGCDQQVRHDVRQGAYDVFSAGLSSFYSELSDGVTSGISGLAGNPADSQTQTP